MSASGEGWLVTLEGGEGAGKSTQLSALAERAGAAGIDAITCREPGGTTLGERLRAALLGSGEPPRPVAELLTFAAARAELVETVIRPALARGAMVLCDRFVDSTTAYQHYGRGLPLDTVRTVNDIATGGLRPDLTVLLDISPEGGRGRNGEAVDYLEREGPGFHERVRLGFLDMARGEPERWLVLDATRPVEDLTDVIWERTRLLFEG